MKYENMEIEFDGMVKAAQGVLVLDTGGNSKGVATALLTDKDTLHLTCCRTFPQCDQCSEELRDYLNGMAAAGESRIIKMVSVHEYGIEIPCGWFRQAVYDMNYDNEDTEILLVAARPLKTCLPPSAAPVP